MRCVFAETLYTGRSIEDDVYLAFDGRTVRSVGKKATGDCVGRFACVTPAFVDPHSHIGMHRAGEPGSEGEANEQLDSLLPLPDALDSIQMDDTAFRDAIEMGVLYSCCVPGSGNIIGGLSAVIRHYAVDTNAALIARAGLKAAFGYNPMSTRSWKGTRPFTRMGALGLLRQKLLEVKDKAQRVGKARGAKKKETTFTPAEEVYRDLLARKLRLRVHVHKIDDIAALLRFVDEFGLDVTVEHACDVHDGAIFAELKRRKIPVTYGPVDCFAYKTELKHENWRNVRLLVESGVDYGLMTDHPVVSSRQLFLQTRWFTRCGLSKQEAIELVTRRNAELLGLSRQLGTLGTGKWASFVCFDGDPFDITSYPVAVYGEGEPLFEAD